MRLNCVVLLPNVPQQRHLRNPFNSFMTEAVMDWLDWNQWTGFYVITASVMKELSKPK